ncbi:MAG: TolB family protein [Bdellovibrionales bacterium]
MRFLCLTLMSCILSHSAFASASNSLLEPVPTGCQDLGALRSKPIALTGKIFANYLPDGKRYTKRFPLQPPDLFEVGILDLANPTAGIQRLTQDGVNDSEIAVSPDGKKIVWSRRPLLGNFEGDNSIVMANPDLTDMITLAYGKSTYLGIPTFVPPLGQEVVFSQQGEKDEFTKLVFHNLSTGQKRELKTTFKGSIGDPQISPDGKLVAFKSYEQKDTDEAQLYIMKINGKGVRRLTRNDYKDEDPAFSPDGKTLAFERMYGMSRHKGDHPKDDWYFKEGIVTMDLKTGKERAVTKPDPCGKNEFWLPTWSPDGELIMFTRGLHLENGEFAHDLWVMRKDGSDLQKVAGSDGIMFFDWVY